MMEPKHIEALEAIVGKENVHSDKAHLIAYSYDATRTHFEPDAVLFPRHEEDVSRILVYCNKHRIVLTPRGAGSGFTGGALPVNGGLVLAMEKHMNKILERHPKHGSSRPAWRDQYGSAKSSRGRGAFLPA